MKPRVLMLHAEHTGVGYQRILMPAKWLKRRGWKVDYFPDAPPHDSLTDRGITPLDWYNKNAKRFDLVVAGKTTILSSIEFLCKMRKFNNKPLVMDFDDHFLGVPKYNMSYFAHHQSGTASKTAKLQLLTSDACTTTTKYMKDLYDKDTRSITVLPNCVDIEDWGPFSVDPLRQNDRAIRIVFAGGAGRYGDLMECKDAITRIMDEFSQVQLFFMGCFPDWAVRWCSDDKDPRNNRAFNLSFSTFRDFRKMLAWGKFDIALAPLEANDFNLCKSNIKYLDHAMANICGVYSGIETYSRDVQHENTGMLANGCDEWYESLKTLINNPILRDEITRRAHDMVVSHYNIQDNIVLWEEAYTGFASLQPNIEAKAWQPYQYQQQGQGLTNPVTASP